MDSKTKIMQEIVERESKAFLDEGFGGLDLSSYPGLQPLPPEELPEHFDRSGLSRVNGLKQLIENPDPEALAQLAKEDPQLAAQLAEDRATEIARQFVAQNPRYLRTDRNFERIVDFLLRKHLKHGLRVYADADEGSLALLAGGFWNVAELTAAFNKLHQEGELDGASNEPRPLTAVQKQQCAVLASSGDVLGAIAMYVEHRVSQDAADQVRFEMVEPSSFVSDPELVPILREALAFCWANYRTDFAPTPERWDFIWRYIGDRFATVKLMDAAWEALKVAEKDSLRSGLLNRVAESPQSRQLTQADLDEMSDEEVARLKTATLREYARQNRGRG